MNFLLRMVVALFLVSVIPATATERGLIINEDNSHFFTSRSAEDMTLAGLHAFVDQYANTRVSHLFLCPNAMRASFKSATRDAIWELGNQHLPAPGMMRLWMTNAQRLHEKGLDPYAIWIARAREKGISPWLTMRMNDVHASPDMNNIMHSTFWRENPQFWRVPHAKPGNWVDRALDYRHPEVRAHAMDFIKELLERYDPDGLELDWMRFGWHFKSGEEAEGAETLTAFVQEVRQLTQGWSKRRGHSILLGTRVPAHPDAARGLGMDGVRWAQEGLVDMLVPTPFWTTTDYDIPVELWRSQMGAAADRVVLAPAIEHNSRAYPGAGNMVNDLAATRGFAASAWHRGADQIYLFNYMDSQTRPLGEDEYQVLLQQGLDLALVSGKPRRHIQTFRDTVPSGFPNGVVLPTDRAEASFTLHIGPKPLDGTVTFLIGLAKREGVAEAVYAVTLNGAACGTGTDEGEPNRFPDAMRAISFACPRKAIQEGANHIVVTQPAGQQIIWAELRVTPHADAP